MANRRGRATAVSFFAFQDIITSVVGIFILIALVMALELVERVSSSSQTSTASVAKAVVDAIDSLASEVRAMQAEFDALYSARNSSSSINRFNRETILAQNSEQLQALQQKTSRINQDLQDIKKSLSEAEEITKELIATDRAAESDREELKLLQDRQKQIERYSAVLEIDKPLLFRDETQEGRNVVLVVLQANEIIVSDAAAAQTHAFKGSGCADDFNVWLSSIDLRPRQFLVILKPGAVVEFDRIRAKLEELRAVWGYDVAVQDSKFRLRFEMEAP